jgi:hypothetical protein
MKIAFISLKLFQQKVEVKSLHKQRVKEMKKKGYTVRKTTVLSESKELTFHAQSLRSFNSVYVYWVLQR